MAVPEFGAVAFQQPTATFEHLNLHLLEVLAFRWRCASAHSNRLDIAMSGTLLNSLGPGDKANGVLCPHCRVDLVMSERQGIEIDYCPKCRGVWLDRGELDKIIERSAAEEAQYAQGQAGRGRAQASSRNTSNDCREDHRRDYSDHDRHGGHHGRRHGSFLGRLFD